MRIEQLEYMIEVSKVSSLTTAAENLYMTQSALSRSIKALEEELGGCLLERNSEGVSLTQAGKELLGDMEHILKEIDIFREKASDVFETSKKPEESMELVIYSLSGIIDALFPKALKLFSRKYKNVKIRVKTVMLLEAVELIDSSCQSVIIINNLNSILDSELEKSEKTCKLLFVEQYAVVMRKDSSLAKKNYLTKGELVDYKCIMHHNGMDYDAFLNRNTNKEEKFDILLCSNNPEVVKDMILEYNAVYIAANTVVKKFYNNYSELVSVPLKTGRGALYAIYDEKIDNAPLIDEFLDCIKKAR